MQIFTRNWTHIVMSKQKITNKDDFKHYLCILVFNEHLIAYQSVQSEPWQLLELKGGQQYPHKDNASSLRDVLSDISFQSGRLSSLSIGKLSPFLGSAGNCPLTTNPNKIS
jgi:hypothetical protein